MFSFERQVIDRVIRVAPLGLRFWDGVRGAAVTDGLEVNAYPPNRPWQRTPAFANRSGVFVFLHLPGLDGVETGAVGPKDWSQPQVRRSFIVEVVDRLQRYQPLRFPVDAPVEGLFIHGFPVLASESFPGSQPQGIPLFPTATYRPPGGMAVVRADLRQLTGGLPGAAAPWAVLEALQNGQLIAWGWADKQGKTALIFPYPEPESPSGPSGSVGNRVPLTEQSWDFTLRARFQPTMAEEEIPDVIQALTAPIVRLWENLSPAAQLSEISLSFGAELILRTKPAEFYSELFLSP